MLGYISDNFRSNLISMIMLHYLKQTWPLRIDNSTTNESDLNAAIQEGAALRIRPKAMTVAVIVAGLLPIFLGSGTGSEVMSRIAAPMIGGMLTAPLLSLFILPAAYLVINRRAINKRRTHVARP